MMDPNKAALMGAPGAAAAGAAPGAGQAAGPVVCIASQPDGSFMVYPEGQEDSGQPAKDVNGALAMAQQLLTGQSDQDGDEGQSSTEDDAAALMAGFNQVRNPLNRGA